MRFFGLVLVPNTLSEEDACVHAFELVVPYMRNEKNGKIENFKFDWFVQPDDLMDEEDESDAECTWPVSEIIEKFPKLEIEAIVTPDRQWHALEPFQLWDSDPWVQRARELLKQNQDCIALKHLFHI